jgi:hypothetical protein
VQEEEGEQEVQEQLERAVEEREEKEGLENHTAASWPPRPRSAR